MAIRYPCNQCDKDFNFRIKLNRHVAIVHSVQSDIKVEQDFLKPDLTDDEKVAHFDSLKLKFIDLCDKFSNSEKKFEYLQTQLRALEKSKSRPKKKSKVKSKVIKTFKGFANAAGEYKDIEDDETIPEGWKSALKDAKGLGKGTTLKVYWAPNGRFCSSRRGAIHYMVHELESNNEDVETMKTGLIAEGWMEDDEDIPKGWLYKAEYKRTCFLSSDFQYCKGTRSALKIMLKYSNSDEEIGKFISKYVVTRSVLDHTQISWMKNDSIPYPWRVANTMHRGGKGKVILSPGGQVFTCSKTARDFIDASKDIGAEDKKRFYAIIGGENVGKIKTENTLKDNSENENIKEHSVENNPIKQEICDAWMTEDKYTPPNWKTSSNTMPKRYKNPEGKFLQNRCDAIKHMIGEGSYSEDDIKIMKNGLVDEDGWKTAGFLPDGWMFKQVEYKSQNRIRKFYLSPSFDVLRTLETVLVYMKENGVSEADILKFKDGRPTKRARDGRTTRRIKDILATRMEKEESQESDDSFWREADFLPSNWLFREQSSTYKTPCGKVLSSMKSVVGFMVANNYSVAQIEIFKENSKSIKFKDEESLPTGWKWGVVHAGGKVTGVKMNKYLSPDGDIFNNRATAVKFMIKNNHAIENIDRMKAGLKDDGWSFDENLPHGWMIKEMQSHNPPILLSPSYDTLRKKQEVISFMSEQGFESAEINRIVQYMKAKGSSLESVSSPGNKRKISVGGENLDVSPPKKEKVTEKAGINLKDGKESSNPLYLPPNWTEKKSSDGPWSIFTSPEGQTFNSRLLVVKFLIKAKSDPQTIFKLWSTLDREGWVLGGELLPPGWRVKFHERLFDYKYLTREMAVLSGSDEALKHISDKDDFDKDSVDIFKKWVSAMSSSLPEITWKEDPSLPTGWMISTGLDYEIIKNSKGALFEGQKEAIDNMIKEHYSPGDIFKMWNTLHLEGWISDDENLPTGWKRKFFSAENQHHYLSPMMEVVTSSDTLLDIVKKSKDYQEEEAKKVEKWIEMGN